MGHAAMGVAYATCERVWIICTSLSVFGVMVAAFTGVAFVNYGQNTSSLLMSVGFLIALVPLLIGLFLTSRPNS